jgi:thymidylate synthase (FAD)
MRSCYSAHPAYDLYEYSSERAEPLTGERPFDDERVRSLLRKAIDLGHLDILEHGELTFDLQNVSRACTHQLVRHRLASFSQQSQRYVKITSGHGYVRPPSIEPEIAIPVQIREVNMELSFDDMMAVATQMEEGLLKLGIKAEDARYVRPNAATTNVVTSMNPRQLLHVLELRCAPDAQWEIRDLAWAMFACAKLVAPNIFQTLPASKTSQQMQDKISILDAAVTETRDRCNTSAEDELIEIPLNRVGLVHDVRAFVKRV